MSVRGDALLQRAADLIEAGNIADGAAACRQVLAAQPGHPDALHLLAMATRSTDPQGAEQLFRESLARAPRQPSVLVNFANFLRTSSRVAEAEQLLRAAIELAPDFVPGWYNLGILLRLAGHLEDAERCASRTNALSPAYAAGWELRAAIEQQRGDLAAAIAACRSGLRHAPAAARLHYSLGQLLREDCRFAEAAQAYEAALSYGFETPDLYRNRGEAHLEAGAGERALAALDAGVSRYPDNALLHRLRAGLHWETGVAGDPLARLRQAARNNPRDATLWHTLVASLKRLDRLDEADAALDEARRSGCPLTPDLIVMEALRHARAGDVPSATRLFEGLIAEQAAHTGIRLAFIEHLLSSGDPARADRVCAEVLAADPVEQLAWAYRGTAWQLLGDARSAWLLDYERMVMPVPVQPPPGYASRDAFFSDVANLLETLHRTRARPIDQTVRGGTQTSGYLFRLKQPILLLLEEQIRAAVRGALAMAPDDASHPYWGRRPGHGAGDGFRFAGCWSVRLTSQGFHTNHIHRSGWISSALYVALPDEIRGAADRAGHIQFGVPPVETGLALPAQRTIEPQIGELVLFPSYMWHGTVPFTASRPRVTVAFDLVPNG
jgi:Tfp pilus assembly protein PilF